MRIIVSESTEMASVRLLTRFLMSVDRNKQRAQHESDGRGLRSQRNPQALLSIHELPAEHDH